MDIAKRDVLPCRAALMAAVGVPAASLRGARQTHSRVVLRVDRDAPPADLPQADGMVTDCVELVLSVTVADCLPIYILDRGSGAFGIVHSGWKGTGIVLEAIELLRASYGSRQADLSVTIGPGIGACCYRVSEERAAAFRSSFGDGGVRRGPDGAPRIDLRQANVGLLERAGVRDIVVVEDCTACSAELGSLRRQGPLAFTRMLAFIGAWTDP